VLDVLNPRIVHHHAGLAPDHLQCHRWICRRPCQPLKENEAIAAADTLLLTVPNQLGVACNAHLIDTILTHMAPRIGLAVSRLPISKISPGLMVIREVIRADRLRRRHLGWRGYLRSVSRGRVERFGVGPTIVLGQDFAESPGTVRHGPVADLAAGDR
jgi:hypothetical protein